MKRKILSVILSFAMVLSLLPSMTPTASAVDEDVIEISDAAGLAVFRDRVNDGDTSLSATLTADIDLNNEEWTPIGTNDNRFAGTFDGDGHIISGLYINAPSSNYQGLFGRVGTNGTVKNIGVVGGSVTGYYWVGGIVGISGGTVENCSFTGSVIGKNSYIGGIVGEGSSGSIIRNCYFSGSVTGTGRAVGGIVGMCHSTVDNCYNTGEVSQAGSSGVGGIAGIAEEPSVIQSCYNAGKITGQRDVGGVVGSNANDSLVTITNCYYQDGTAGKGVGSGSGSATNGTPTASELGDGWEDSEELGRPVLSSNNEEKNSGKTDSDGPGDEDTGEKPAGPEGTGTAADPYLIPDLDTLVWFRDHVNDTDAGISGKLTDDITMDNTSWTPIGNSSNQFTGTFDGDGHKITGLYINTSDGYQGLFGYVGDGGTVKNVSVSGTITSTSSPVGGIVGYSSGTVQNCYNAANIEALRDVGGIVGWNTGIVQNCYNTGIISDTQINYMEPPAGGIVGQHDEPGVIQNCFSTGTISATSGRAGGIAGINNHATVKDCYWTGTAKDGLGWYHDPCTTTNVNEVSSEQINSGEVAWLLQNGQSTPVWGQRIGTDSDPVLLAFVENPDDYKVCEVTFKNGDEEVDTQYVNKNGKITAPAQPTAPEGQEDYIFGWYAEGSNTAWNFETDTVSKDIALTAKWTDSTTATDPPATEPPTTEPPSTQPPATGGSPGGGSSPTGSVTVSDPDTANGTVKSSTATARKGDTVTISSKADSGYISAAPTVTDKNGNAVAVTQNADGTYSFTMPEGGVTVTGNYVTPGKLYTDVNDNLWYQEPIAYVVENGLMSGVGNQQFNPGGTTTRGMVMTILARQSGIDTTASDGELWYQKGMEWAMGEGVSDGTSPEESISREQLATMLYRFAGEPPVTDDLSAYPDADIIHDWARDAVIWAVQTGIIQGTDGKLYPRSNATRAEAATMLMRFMELGKQM